MSILGNPIQYISRTFNSALSDINSDTELAHKPNWFKRLIAGLVDVTSVWLNAISNNLYLRTSYTRQAVADLLALIDYQLTPASTSSGDLIVFVKSSTGSGLFPITATAAELAGLSAGSSVLAPVRFESRVSHTFVLRQWTCVRSSNTLTITQTVPATPAYDLTYSGHKVRFTTTGTLPSGLSVNVDYWLIYISSTSVSVARSLADASANNAIVLNSAGTGTHTMTLYSDIVPVYQQSTVSIPVTLGTSDGLTAWQVFNLPNSYVISSTLVIIINGVTWTAVTTFVNSLATDKHYKVLILSDNNYAVQFGNGTYGAIPGSFDVTATYSYGGGVNSNISIIDNVKTYAGSNTNVTGLTNPAELSGGADEQTLEEAKVLGPLLLKSRDKFVSVEDGEALMIAYGGISQAAVLRNYYGVLSARCIAVPVGGGLLSTPDKAALQAYLVSKTILASENIIVNDPTRSSINVTAVGVALSGYSASTVATYFNLAWKLMLSETGKQIYDNYIQSGIASTVTLINSIFSTAFTSADYDAVEALVKNLNYVEFGSSFNYSDIYGYIDTWVTGLDTFTFTVFSKTTGITLPLALAIDEISIPGTITTSVT